LTIFAISTDSGAKTLDAIQDPRDGLLEKVDRAELERIVRDLSGANVVYVGDVPVELYTRYALSPVMESARQYLLDEIAGYGYEPILQSFPLSVEIPTFTAIEVSADGDTLWVGDIGKGLIYQATAADEWNTYETIGLVNAQVFDLELDPQERLWAACGLFDGGLGAIHCSIDGGRTWGSIFGGNDIWTFYDITMESDEYGIAVGSYGTVAVASGGGASWSALDPGIFHYRRVNGSAASGEMRFWLVDWGGTLYETEDAGATWSERSLTTNRLFAVDFWDAKRGVIVGDYVSFHTADSGATWTEVPVDAQLSHVTMVDSLRVIAGGQYGVTLMSLNGGATWIDGDQVCPSYAIVSKTVAGGENRCWLAGGNVVRRYDFGPPHQCTYYEIADTMMGSNISFLHEGSESPERRIILCAHYDSFAGYATSYECAPGADDNATGVAAVLAAAEALAGSWTEKSIEFVLFDGEELGLLGSRYFVAGLDEDLVYWYEAVVNLDMIGYDYLSDRSLLIVGNVDDHTDSLLADVVIETAADLPLDLYPYYSTDWQGGSDHMPFRITGIPSVLLIEGKSLELTPDYHKCSDEASTIDYGYLEECAKVALGTVARLAGYVPASPDTARFATARLRQNWPNPFSEGTTIAYYLPISTSARLSVYDVSGREVARLFSDVNGNGWRDIAWDGKGRSGNRLVSGIYFLRLESGAGTDVRKIVILR
jgi:photosystem II stability/assembly factor-like uncharacterized protein